MLSRRLLSSSPKSVSGQIRSAPSLPIPTIQNLKEKYLQSCRPVLTSAEFETTQKITRDFFEPEALGTLLQSRLVAYSELPEQKNTSWLKSIWLNKAYLEWREPSVINVNWWAVFKDHPLQPADLLIKPPPADVISSWQVKRAAGLISNMVNIQQIITKGNYPPETIRDQSLCMDQFSNIFGMTRIPGKTCDSLKVNKINPANHIIVMIKDQLFKVPVISPEGSRVTLQEIERVLFECGQNCLSTVSEPPIGQLTSGHRDNWYGAYTALQQFPENNTNFDDIDDSMFVVCLDDNSMPKNIDFSHKQFFHNNNGRNRWFDKCVQIIVASSGRAGCNGEHTPADAVVPGKLFEYVIENEPATNPNNCDTLAKLQSPTKLVWKTTSEITAKIEIARKTAFELAKSTESCLLQTRIYGARYMKEVAKTSPDAYIQLALQLAYYRLHKEITPVYETASTRIFSFGRTETGRSMSSESSQFIRDFDNDSVLYETKRQQFTQAVAIQSKWMKESAAGRGIDRHLLGLRCMLQPQEMENAALFLDPSYQKSMYFKLSTSNMSPGKWFYGGFGPVVMDGYGVNYAIAQDDLKFSISSKFKNGNPGESEGRVNEYGTNPYKLRMHLERTLVDLLILFPKRSDVWGAGWQDAHADAVREQKMVETMKGLENLSLVGSYRTPLDKDGNQVMSKKGKKGKK